MGTAVLDETSALLDKNAVLIRTETLFSKKNVWDELAHRLQLAGHDAEAVCEGVDELDLSRYLDNDTLKYIDSVQLVDNWDNNNE
jgi:hypothetical protein